MRGRYPAPGISSYSFGPGPLTPAIKVLIAVNVVVFVLGVIGSVGVFLEDVFGLQPAETLLGLHLWQPLTYMFLHGGIFHLLFNMLALWMFGTELERMWGSRFFAKYYFVSGVGAACTTIVLSLLPLGTFAQTLWFTTTIGASGAIYGILLAYALYFPHRPIYLWMLFPIPARVFVMIIGAIALFSSMQGGGGIAHTTHLGGLVAGYLYLKGTRIHLLSELQYRVLKWRINRARRRFDVHQGGRKDIDRRVH